MGKLTTFHHFVNTPPHKYIAFCANFELSDVVAVRKHCHCPPPGPTLSSSNIAAIRNMVCGHNPKVRRMTLKGARVVAKH